MLFAGALTKHSACRIRDLNDEINKLIREKGHWERRIVQLGGPDYAKNAPKTTDAEGNEVSSPAWPAPQLAGLHHIKAELIA